MESLLKLLPFLEGKSAKIAFAAALIDTFIAGVVLIIFSGTPISTNIVLKAAPYPYILASLYVIFFFVIWFIIYIQEKSENEDGFTLIRKKLVGQWIVDYGSPYGLNSDRRLAHSALGCSIFINPANRKLELKFRIRENRIYTDDESQIIKIISIRNDHDYYYNLFYYFKGERRLQRSISEAIEPELGHHSTETIEVEFLARVTFEAPSNAVKVLKMSGEWYDLNGNISKLLALLAAVEESQVDDEEGHRSFERKPLSDIGVPAFSASMGTIDFSRDA